MMSCAQLPTACLLMPVTCPLVATYRPSRPMAALLGPTATVWRSPARRPVTRVTALWRPRIATATTGARVGAGGGAAATAFSLSTTKPLRRVWTANLSIRHVSVVVRHLLVVGRMKRTKSSKLNNEVEVQKSPGVEIRDRGSRELVEGARCPDQESAISSPSNHRGGTKPPKLPRDKLPKLCQYG